MRAAGPEKEDLIGVKMAPSPEGLMQGSRNGKGQQCAEK